MWNENKIRGALRSAEEEYQRIENNKDLKYPSLQLCETRRVISILKFNYLPLKREDCDGTQNILETRWS